MISTTKKLILIDAMALIYRGHFAMMNSPRMTTAGINTSAAFVFTNVILELLQKEEPDYFVVAFDTPEPTHRHVEYAEYKAQREEMPEDLEIAIPQVEKLCQAMKIPILRAPGWEADDIIGTLTLEAEKKNLTSYMVTPDKDYAQLVSAQTFMYKPRHRGGGYDVLGEAEILESWGIERVDQVIDILGLMGDSSDNVPGVPGIGQKTAQQLISQFDSVENLLDHLDELKGKRKETLEDNREQALLSKRLVTIDRSVPLDIPIESLAVSQPDDDALREFFAELEFRSFGKRMFGEDFEEAVDSAKTEERGIELSTSETTPHLYTLIKTKKDRHAFIHLLQEQTTVCFDSETTGLDSKQCRPIGLAFSWKEHEAYYVAIPQNETAAVLEEFRPFFEDEGIEKIGHNLKFDFSVLRWHGMTVRGPIFDTMIAAYLAVPDLKRNMDALAEELLDYRPIAITALIGEKGDDQKTLLEVDLKQVAEYAGEDADITWQLATALRPLLADRAQERVFYEIEMPLLPVLVEMEYEGIRLDPGALTELSAGLQKDIESTSARVFELAGEEFTLNSPKQLGAILFDKLALDPKAKRTQKSGQYVTNEQVLTRLAPRHEIAQQILDYRMCTKLKSTYVDALPNAVLEKTGRVHTHYEQAVTATGRMQSHNPNLQNIPIRSARGREIRKAFVPRDKDFDLLAADYSQIELRIAAEVSGDEALMSAFESELDIHTTTAAEIYHVDADDVTSEMRGRAKMVNFGILYGISAFGLSERTGISRHEAAELIEKYFEQYARLRRWMDSTIESARENGYVETLMGRRRYLRDINSRNATTRKAEERNAMNSPIQGTAADMIKIAMHRIQARIDKEGLRSRMLLQVHDELVFDLHKTEDGVLQPIVEEGMRTAIETKVPIVVEMGVGENWLVAH
ncbi:MAG: DNA polymerase I [Verrucomicrobia bacterium]|nr:DNA polymerase I [Verrucomicrobiota bacterium]MDA1086449.1 DNA polymerase I [Verrucomicrobiota bacterium]